MKLRKAARILLWTASSLLVALLGIYLLRWPLFGGLVRGKLADLVAQNLQSEVEVGHLGGSLLWSIRADDVTLKPRPGAPFRSAALKRVAVKYGFLGSGEPSVTVEGARFELSRKEGPAPPLHETVRDIVSLLRSLRFPGAVAAAGVDVVLPDGRTVSLDRGALDHARWNVSLRTQGFGTVEGSATLGPEGELTFEGKASEGPVRSARIELGKGGDRCPLRLAVELKDHPLDWAGTAFFEKGALVRIEGDLSVKEGRASTRVDLTTGRVEADVDAVIALDQEGFKGDVAVTGHADGPLEGTVESWSLRDGRVKTKGATFRDLKIDEADIALSRGTLSEIAFKGVVRSGADRLEAEGILRPKPKLEIEATVNLTAADIAPYLKFVPDAPAVACEKVHAEGKLVVRDPGFSFDGSVVTGPGAFAKKGWSVVTFKGSLSLERIEARELHIYGSSFAEEIAATGTLDKGTLALKFRAGPDQGEVGGRLEKDGAFDGRIRMEGPMAWLRSPDIGLTLPENLTPMTIVGRVTGEKEETRIAVDLKAGADVTLSPVATIRSRGKGWRITVAPGTLTLPARKVDYGAVVVDFEAGKVSLENLSLACSPPEIKGRITGGAQWDAREIRIQFGIAEASIGGRAVDPLAARVTVDRATNDVVPEIRWGKETGDHLRITGRWGGQMDLQAELRIGDLKSIKDLLPVEIGGSIGFDAHVTGTVERPEATGTLNLSKLAAAGLPPISLVLPVKAENGALRFWSVAERTPYGSLSIDGTIPLPRSEVPLHLSARLATDDFSPLLEKLPKQTQVWIPRGAVVAEVALEGTLADPRLTGHLEFDALRFKLPPPLAEATDLRIAARLDSEGVIFDMVDGLLGGGPFWASGRWSIFKPGLPLSLWVTGMDALVVDDPLARIRVSPDVQLTIDGRHGARVSGRVDIPLAIYHREFTASVPGGQATARRVTAPRLRLIPGESGGFLIPGIEGLEALDIDLQFVTTGEFRIENSVVGVLLHAEGTLTGTASDPVLSAVIRSREKRGEVKVASGMFIRIEQAEATLPEDVGREPTVRFRGRVGAGEGAIRILVDGPLDGPTLILQSDPPLPQNELLARLAFNVGSGALSSEAGVATLAVYLYEQTLDNWPDADRTDSFFDKFRPTVVGDTSQLRRRPWELPPTGTLRSTSLRTEYVYNSFFSIIGETNREGDVASDLKLRIRF